MTVFVKFSKTVCSILAFLLVCQCCLLGLLQLGVSSLKFVGNGDMGIQVGLFLKTFDVIGTHVESILLDIMLFACLHDAYTFDNVVELRDVL